MSREDVWQWRAYHACGDGQVYILYPQVPLLYPQVPLRQWHCCAMCSNKRPRSGIESPIIWARYDANLRRIHGGHILCENCYFQLFGGG